MRIKKQRKAKPRPKVVIDYPPVPTKKWIPPEKRKKPPKPEPLYVKPEGMSQKLAISSLKKVWNNYEIYGDAGILTGNFSQTHKRFPFKSNGFQGACNTAIACIYADLYKMSMWSSYLLNDILIRGDELYVRSTQQGDKCLIEVPPEKIYHSFFMGNRKITISVSSNSKVVEELKATSEEKTKEVLVSFIENFLANNTSGIFYDDDKYTAIWVKEGVYYFFDPTEHNELGYPWTGIAGFGFSLLGRFKKIATLGDYIYKNFPSAKVSQSRFYLVPCGIARIVSINVEPPETFELLAPQDVVFTKIIEDNIPVPPNRKFERLKEYIQEDKVPKEPMMIQIQELSPEVPMDFPPSRRPSFLPEGPIEKNDLCRYPVPIPTYLKGENAKLSYYTELVPNKMGILRGNICQTNPNFSKYLGRQSMGNALSALIMLRFSKSKHWVPRIVDAVMKNGEILYRDAMLTIPRTHTLRLSNFPKKIEYEGRKFTPDIDEYALVGQMQSQDFEIMDLGPALEEFMTDRDCCIILGPQILAVWLEDGVYYMFDPNERDINGQALIKATIVGSNVVNLEPPSGVACVVWCKDINDLANLYVHNTERERRSERFYLSGVLIKDYVEVSEDWNNFVGEYSTLTSEWIRRITLYMTIYLRQTHSSVKILTNETKFYGLSLGNWILRGTFSQAGYRFPPETRNNQGTANAFMALAMQTVFDVKEWSNDTVDEILMYGDNFYRLSVARLQEKEAFSNPLLMLSELNRVNKIRDKEANFELEECIVNGLVNAKNKNDLSDIHKGLQTFFSENGAGVLTTREISLAIWQKDGAFYYLDPYSRDDKGLATGYGTSCVMRFVCINELAGCIEANLDPNTDDFFNITKVSITVYESSEDGFTKPPLNNYTAINNTSAILRSWLNEEDEKYEVRKGRQTVPMCLTAMGFNKLKPSLEWTRNDMDVILDKGDEYYLQSMAKVQKEIEAEEADLGEMPEGEDAPLDSKAGGDTKPPPPPAQEEQGTDEEEEEYEEDVEEEEEEQEPVEVEVKMTSENVIPEFNIGPNNLKMEFSNIGEGNIRESLKTSIRSFYEQEQTDENFNQEALLETKHYNVAMWRDDKAFYLFDSKPRDKNGEVIGKEDWDPEPPMLESTIDIEKDDDEEEVEEVINMNLAEGTEEEGEEEEPFAPAPAPAPAPVAVIRTGEEMGEEEEGEEEEGEEEEEEEGGKWPDEELDQEEEEEPEKIKRSPSYWSEQEKTGRAFTRWFLNLEDLINFVYENIPVRDRIKTDFVLNSVNIVNNLQIKNKFRPENERENVYAGDWYDFKEVDFGQWIMRATLDLRHELFPESNRGKQTLTTSLIALGIAHIYEMTCFSATVPDSIIVYGDKLYTFMKKCRKKQLLKDANNLKEGEIDWLVQHEEFTISDLPAKICVSRFMFEVTIEPNVVTGDIKAQNFEDILDVHRGMKKFFEDAKYGILFARGIYVAIWRGEKIFYMFDGLKRGPNGIQSTMGTGCITRYLGTEKMANVFLQNLPAFGKSEFLIHKVSLSRNLCPRERAPFSVTPPPKAVTKLATLKAVVNGKFIIRGTISQEDSRFGKGPNVMSAPIAIVALTMSIVHKPETWAKPIVDEIVVLGSELYEDSVNELGFDFNPWEDTLDIYRVKKDFLIGVIKANCELRHTDQRGLIDVKDSNIQNLRRGMERFFEENTHGILITEPFTLALWEQQQDEGDPMIYMFDPNPRSSTGMPLYDGTACVLSFVNAKLASDHIIGCILDPSKRSGEYIIVPVEIVVGSAGTIRKAPKKSPTRSSINILPRCSNLVAAEQKKKLRKLAEEERKKKEAKKQEMIGRNGYHLKGGEAILRGYRSQNSHAYCPESRNNQDIPNCIVAVVMHSLLPIDGWNYKHIDVILDTGDQLYIDSYIAYGPKDPKLGMQNILRKFFMGSLEVHVTIYKPVITEVFTPSKLTSILEAFFQQETMCILSYNQQWITMFLKSGYYFVFDPHERDLEGNLVKPDKIGAAVVIRFENPNAMALKIVHNLGGNTEEAETFSLWLISVDTK